MRRAQVVDALAPEFAAPWPHASQFVFRPQAAGRSRLPPADFPRRATRLNAKALAARPRECFDRAHPEGSSIFLICLARSVGTHVPWPRGGVFVYGVRSARSGDLLVQPASGKVCCRGIDTGRPHKPNIVSNGVPRGIRIAARIRYAAGRPWTPR